MDFEQDNNRMEPMGPEPSQPPPLSAQVTPPAAKKPKKGAGWKIFWGIVLALSVLANIVLFMMLVLVSMAAVYGIGQKDIFAEEVIRKGPRTKKIAVVSVQGIIDDERVRDVCRQLKLAREDKWVKGLIVRVNSPGGTVSGSDQIYNEILKYRDRDEEDKPAVAFMQGIAASGGYYASVACNKIVAEPTTITGSLGVMIGYLVLQELLEDKLGILPVIIKSGEKKDWPSSFRAPTEEQLRYVEEKLLRPAHNRFVEVVAEGRTPLLTLADVKRLADGSIYGAEEARKEKLIDEVGYLDEAIEEVMALAGIDKAQVVEYRKPFSLAGLLSSRSRNILRINKTALYELGTPQLLYLWTIGG